MEHEIKIKDYDCKLIIRNIPSETSPSNGKYAKLYNSQLADKAEE